ncbi:DUF2535 family protein [Alkalihalobacterium alkalicellulosilyticum]|uniref:DUF2535 family protein n=1 Tax=Alkalihalobacterium alkalicellulosilyticum TaxID=1912214 RepID=UPI000996301B|nr:DUF2535 family protein [Bacillus alkalicellulosilyticus]
MITTTQLELFHRTGRKYVISDIPLAHDSGSFFIEFHLQMLIDDIERATRPLSHYSFATFLSKVVDAPIDPSSSSSKEKSYS